MRIFLLSLIFILTACSQEVSKPDYVISEQKMTELLVEIHLLEAKVNQLRIPSDSAQEVYSILQNELFENFEVDSIDYVRSIEYYAEDPDRFHDMYEIVVDSLMVKEKSKKL